MQRRGAHIRGLDIARSRAAVREPVSRTESNQPILIVVAAFSIVLVTAPTLLGGSGPGRLLVLVPFLFCVAWSLPRQDRGLISNAAIATLALYVLTLVIEVLRGAHGGLGGLGESRAITDALTFVVLTTFAVTLLTSARNSREQRLRLFAVALAPAVYIATNVILLQLVGQPSNEFSRVAQGTPAVMLGYLGIPATRILFPLAQGVNYFGAVAAAGFASAILLLLRTSIDRRLAVIAAAICMFGVLTTDSRGALLISIGVILAFVLVGRIRSARGVAAIVPIAPVAVAIGFGLLANSGAISAFGRPTNGISSSTTRLDIWGAVLNVLSHPSLAQIVGYGANGQVTSGASLHYEYLFSYLATPATVPAHNLVLQTILDAGYFGLMALMVALAVAAVRLARVASSWPQSPVPALFAILVVLFVNGATESLPTPIVPEAMALVLLVMGVSVALSPARDPSRSTPASQVRATLTRGRPGPVRTNIGGTRAR